MGDAAALVPAVLPGQPCLGRTDDFDAVVSGDFNGDSRRDLAFGAPRTDLYDDHRAGAVLVFHGTAVGDVNGVVRLDQGDGERDANEMFGAGLAAGDFDGDGYDDLAVGAPEENRGTDYDRGSVHVFRGGPEGLTPWATLVDATSITGSFRFGQELAAGDVDGDGRDELVVAAPRSSASSTGRGQLSVFRGTSGGLTPWHVINGPSDPAIPSSAQFGSRMIMADMSGDGRADLAVVTDRLDQPGDALNAAVAVYISRVPPPPIVSRTSTFGPFPLPGGHRLTYQTTVRPPSVRPVRGFGTDIAVADFTGDSIGDLVVSAPNTVMGMNGVAGALYVFAGSSMAYLREVTFGAADARLGGSIAAGDMTGDGRADIAASSTAGTVFFRQTPSSGLLQWAVERATEPRLIARIGPDAYGELVGTTRGFRGRASGSPGSWRMFSSQEPFCTPTWGPPPEIELVDRTAHTLRIRYRGAPGTETIRAELGWSNQAPQTFVGETVTVDYEGLTASQYYCPEATSRLAGVADSTEMTPDVCFWTTEEDDDGGGGGGGGGGGVTSLECGVGFTVCEAGWHPIRFEYEPSCPHAPSDLDDNATVCAEDDSDGFNACGDLNCPEGFYTQRIQYSAHCVTGTSDSPNQSVCEPASGSLLFACGECPSGYSETGRNDVDFCDGFDQIECTRD